MPTNDRTDKQQNGQPLPHGNQPPKPKETEKATQDNDLTTGHSQPGDGGDDNAKDNRDA